MLDTIRPGLRLARRELRGGLRGFWIFLGCLMLGVAAIAGVGSLSTALMQGIADDSRALLGGDIAIRRIHTPASEAQQTWLTRESARLSRVTTLRAMARTPGGGTQTLVELKAVDAAYPLFGSVRAAPSRPLDRALGRRNGRWGALVDQTLARRMNLAAGDTLRIGEVRYRVRGTIQREPDRATQIVTLGARVMVSRASLDATGLVQPGSLVYHHYRIDLPTGTDAAAWERRLDERFPDAGWRVRSAANAEPGVGRFIDRVTLFMTLVGLTALLVGGVGVANAVRAYLDGKRATIATFKCVGAPARLVFVTYLAQVLVLAGLGIGAGLVVGAALPLAAEPVLAQYLNFRVQVGVYPGPLAVSAVFGVLTTLAFALWPLARAQAIPAAALFRDTVAPRTDRPPVRAIAGVGAACAALAGLAVWTADDRLFALGFVAGAAGALLAFRLAAAGVVALARRLPRARRPALRLAVANLHRPGAPTGGVVLSLGLGLTVLVAIALIEGNLTRQITQRMPADAPAYYFIDIHAGQLDGFKRTARSVEGVHGIKSVPMLRGRITKVNGTRVGALDIPDEVEWMFDGDRGITWSRTVPRNSTVVRGDWWSRDYQGRQLVSIDAELGRAMNLKIGDTLTINLLGRNIPAEIANFRKIAWESLGINFVMVFSPGIVSEAPQSYLATADVPPDNAAALESAMAAKFPNISAIRTRDVLNRVAGVLSNIATAVRAVAGLTLLAGALVLAGAVAAGHRQRIYDAVVLKVMGATRRDISAAFVLEYGILGAITAAIAAIVGSVAAWIVLTRVMDATFTLLPVAVGTTVVLATGLTLAVGYAGTARALRQKAAPLLRNE